MARRFAVVAITSIMGEIIVKLHDDEWQKLPGHLKTLFVRLPNNGSDEVLAGFPETGAASGGPVTSKPGTIYGGGAGLPSATTISPSDNGGSAARFFYSAKAGPLDRLGSKHPTVKPVDLMRWLCRLITPPGGLILEPFAGSGTTGIAAMAEGFNCEMVDIMPDHVADIERKLAMLRGELHGMFDQHISRREDLTVADLPLFGGDAPRNEEAAG